MIIIPGCRETGNLQTQEPGESLFPVPDYTLPLFQITASTKNNLLSHFIFSVISHIYHLHSFVQIADGGAEPLLVRNELQHALELDVDVVSRVAAELNGHCAVHC